MGEAQVRFKKVSNKSCYDVDINNPQVLLQSSEKVQVD